jgi:hypothetical protein
MMIQHHGGDRGTASGTARDLVFGTLSSSLKRNERIAVEYHTISYRLAKVELSLSSHRLYRMDALAAIPRSSRRTNGGSETHTRHNIIIQPIGLNNCCSLRKGRNDGTAYCTFYSLGGCLSF